MYLCFYCPVQEYYQYKIRGAKGLYSTTHDTVSHNRPVAPGSASDLGKKLWTPGS
jgi:hypothetical protein